MDAIEALKSAMDDIDSEIREINSETFRWKSTEGQRISVNSYSNQINRLIDQRDKIIDHLISLGIPTEN